MNIIKSGTTGPPDIICGIGNIAPKVSEYLVYSQIIYHTLHCSTYFVERKNNIQRNNKWKEKSLKTVTNQLGINTVNQLTAI